MTPQLMLEFYQAFSDARPNFIAAGVPPVETLDRYRGQPSNPKEFEYYKLPAIFISRQTVWTKVGNVYNGATAFEFHIEMENTGNTANLYDDKEEGLQYHKFVNECRKVIDTFKSERISVPVRTTDREVDTGVTIYEAIGYAATYYEDEQEGKYLDGTIETINTQGVFVKKLE